MRYRTTITSSSPRNSRFMFFFSSRRRHTRWPRDWSSDVCSSDLEELQRQLRTLREELDRRQVEQAYREEELRSLRSTLEQQSRERAALLQHSGNQVLQRLARAGVTFVVCQPGVEQMTVPLEELGLYLDAPMRYTAGRRSEERRVGKEWSTREWGVW